MTMLKNIFKPKNIAVAMLWAMCLSLSFPCSVKAQALLPEETKPTYTPPTTDWNKQAEQPNFDPTKAEEYKKEAKQKSYENNKKANADCKIPELKKRYLSSCYSCEIVKTLLEVFTSVSAKTYKISHDAGIYVLAFATILWLSMFALKTVSSFANIEPADMVNQIIIQLFKVLLAYVVIISGLSTFTNYIVNPILSAGADYGTGIVQSLGKIEFTQYSSSSSAASDGVLSQEVITKLLGLNQAIDHVVANNMVIGSALACHSYNAGVLKWGPIKILDLWIWLCGIAIWILGFLMTVAVSYYLLDIAFKIGLAIVVMPIAMALWPFAPTKDKLKVCVSIIMSSAATFAFLAITTSFGFVLIEQAFGGDDVDILTKIEQGRSEEISYTFDVTGKAFLILLFCYIYAFLLIGKTISDYSSRFFKDEIKASPMHGKLTQATSAVKQTAVGAAKLGKDIAKTQTKKAVKKGASNLKNAAKNKMKKWAGD